MGNSVVGLDIGSTALRGVELSGANKAKPNLLRFFEVPLPPGAVSRGEVVDENEPAPFPKFMRSPVPANAEVSW